MVLLSLVRPLRGELEGAWEVGRGSNMLKKLFSRASEDATPLERLAVQKANAFDSRHPLIINAILIIEAIIFFSVIFMEV